jgi:Tol biopolymer transport system component/photosystem II stability/assembly factor-like uncharacterized protein
VIDKNYGRLPLSFELNRGQIGANARYLARGPGYNIFLTPAEAVLVFQSEGKNKKNTAAGIEGADELKVGPAAHLKQQRARELDDKRNATRAKPTVVRMRLEGANLNTPAAEGLDQLPGKVSYFLGNDSSKWLTDIPTYSKVAYRNVYSGVDLIYYGNQQQLEYDLVVAPGADPGLIQIAFDGPDGLRVDKQGNLLLETRAGKIQQNKPAIFQEVDGARKEIKGRYVLKPGHKIGFKVSRYDRRKPLVIDPILKYLSFVNGSGEGIAITTDPAGSAYITGIVSASSLNATPGAFQIASGGLGDTFVTKINQAGNGVVYTTYLGGSGDDYGNGIAVDVAGNAYIAGFTSGNFPTTPGAFQSTSQGGGDGYITKLNASGNALVFSTLLGGNDSEEADGIALDPNTGAVYVSGLSASTNLPVTAGAFRSSNAGGYDCYAAKLNANGTALIYLTYAGGGGFDYPIAMTADSSGNVYLAGQTSSLNFSVQNAFQSSHGGAPQGFFKSSNGGTDWNLSRNNLPSTHVFSIAINPNTASTVYVGTFGGVYQTTDGGANWSPTGPIPTIAVRQLLIDPTATNIIYAGTTSGVFKSTDGGSTWVARNNGLLQPDIAPDVRGLALHPSSPNTIYASGFGGIFKTTDGGANWTAISNGLPTNVSAATTNGIVVDPSAPNTVYVTIAGFQRVYKTTDGGANWTAAGTGLPVTAVNTLTINPSSPATIYAGTRVGVYRTTDGGTSWSVINSGLLLPLSDATTSANPTINAIAVDPANPLNLYAAPGAPFATNGSSFAFATIFKSTDGGNNWSAQTSGFNNANIGFASVAVDPTNPSIVYAGNFGDFDAFLLKLNASGTGATYSTYLGGARGDFASGVAVDGSNNVYVSGSTRGNGFPITAGAFQTTLKGGNDFFVAKFDASGTSLAYSTYLGGTEAENASGGLAVDVSGNAYVTGSTFAPDFPVTPAAFQTTIGNPGIRNADIFVTKLNPSGSALVYSSYLGGGGNDTVNNFSGNRISLDAAANAYVLGVSSSTNFPAFDFLNGGLGNSQTFVAKIDGNTASYSITGRLTTSTSTPIAGVVVEVGNGQGFLRSATSDSQGFYSLISLPAGNYTVTPNRNPNTGSHYLFSPPSQTFTGLSSDQTANFQGTQVYNIAGQVTSSTVAGLGIFDVTVTLSDAAASTTITDANGNFLFPDLLPGNYTVTPTNPGFTFNPVNLSFTNLSADQFSANFTTASAVFFTVSGHVADTTNANVSSALISMQLISQKGSRGQSALTDESGNYSFPNLQAGGNYTFIVTKPLLSFTPQGPTLSNLSGNQTLNFTASQPTGLIGKIAFIGDSNGIYVMNADGTTEQNIFSANPQCSGADGIAWSPDGAKLAFEDCGTNSTSDLYVVNANGTGVQRLTNAPFEDVLPSWSPDGTRLTFSYAACSGTDSFAPQVFAINGAGTIRSRLTNSVVFDAFSDWSPGGSTIAFSRGNTGDCSSTDTDIYVVDANGGVQTKLTNSLPKGLAPAYSPDGFKIAYLRDTSPNSSVSRAAVYVMNADGTGQTKITPDLDLREGRPAWSPDGSKIAFLVNLMGIVAPTEQIFVVNADGTGLTQITSGTARHASVAWQHYSISGQVTGNASGVPITMALAGTLTRVTQTDANGNYVFGNLTPGGNYSVSAISTAFGFNPAKADITNLAGNQIANFTVLPQVIPAPTPPLADDFNDPQRDPTKWNLGTQTQPLGAFDPQVSVVQQNGTLVVTPLNGAAGLHYNGYVAVNSFDFRSSTATVQVAQIATGEAETIFAIGSDLDNFSRFVVRAGGAASNSGKAVRRPLDTAVPQLIFQVRVAGQLTSLSIPYDPVQHKFMRFRHEPLTNSVVFETGPDNLNFTVRHTVPLQKGVSALTAELSAGTSTATNPGQAVFDNFQLVTNTFQFAVTGYSVNETDGTVQITVTRSGDRTMAASVDYATFDETAQQLTRYIPAVGTLSFAPGEMSREFSVLVEDNFLVEGNQTVSLRLLDSFGAGLSSPGRAVLTIADNDTLPITTNPLDDSKFLVQQSYFDFLGRAPDQSGLDYWQSQITQCGTNQQCISAKRIDVSNAFFYEQEFQQTGSYVYRLYRLVYGNTQPFPNPFPDPNYPGEDKKLISYATFVSDRARVLGGSGLAQSQFNLANSLTVRPEFLATYPLSLDGPAFVDAILAKMRDHLGVDLTAQRSALVILFNQGGRGAVIYRLADDNQETNPIINRPFLDAEYNRAFVATQYFGYLRRDADLGGFTFWLGQVNSGPLRGTAKQHDMVCSFITAAEFQQRFSSVVTRTNSECPQF